MLRFSYSLLLRTLHLLKRLGLRASSAAASIRRAARGSFYDIILFVHILKASFEYLSKVGRAN